MNYQVKIIYPKEEAAENNKLTERTFNEFIDEVEADELISQYEKLLAGGYSITVNFLPPELDKDGEESDPFIIAETMELAGIPYKATLKLKASGTYEEMLKITKIVEQEGFDYDVTVKLQVRENSIVDFEKVNSWQSQEHAKYTVIPKASSQDIADLRTLYERLSEEPYKLQINVKAKVKKDDDESFASQLAAYPEETLVTFRLSDAEIYSE
ncbi:MAG: hypothetical protein ACK5LM_02015 [Lactovum sp.]